MSSNERQILQRMRTLSQAQLSPQDVEQMLAAARKALADHAPAVAADQPDPPSLRPVPEASYGSAGNAPRGAATSSIRWRVGRFIMRPSGKALAAGIVLAVGMLTLWIVLGRGASVAFADVLRQIHEIHTVKCKRIYTLSLGNPEAKPVTSDVIVADQYRERTTHSDGTILITDTHGAGRSLSLDPKQKQAIFLENKDSNDKWPHDENLLKKLTTFDNATTAPLGYRQINGKEAQGFRLTIPNTPQFGHSEVWIDVETRLPLLIESDVTPMEGMKAHIVSTDFEWNIPVDPSLVDMTPPADYKVTTNSMDMSELLRPLTEAELIDALKTGAEFLNDGKFLPDLRFTGVLAFIKKNKGLKSNPKLMAASREEQTRVSKVIAVGMKFNPDLGEDFHYAGANVPVGQADTPIFWYRPKDSAFYHVIYADLTVKEVTKEGLPKVSSVTIPPGVDVAAIAKMMKQSDKSPKE